MKSIFKALTLSCLGVVMALAVVISAGCTPPPPPPTNDIISKVLLFENPSAPTNLFRAVSYARTATTHKFYVKTTFVRSKYVDELTNLDSRIGTATRDFWGQFFMGIDITSKTPAVKNAVKVGVKIHTANTDFDFDALFRCASWDPSGGVRFNKADGVPFIAESGNFLLNVLNDGEDPSSSDFWSVASETFWMAKDDKDDSAMVGGVGKVVNFAVLDETGADVAVSAKVASDYISYDDATGEYVFTIPFTLIAKKDLKSICVFGVENAGWVGSVNAVIKPLGSTESVVYPVAGELYGLTAVSIPQNEGDAPVITTLIKYDGIEGFSDIDARAAIVTKNMNDVTIISPNNDATLVLNLTNATLVTNLTFALEGTNENGLNVYTNTGDTLEFGLGAADFAGTADFSVYAYTANSPAGTEIKVAVSPTVNAIADTAIVTNSTASVSVLLIDGYTPATEVTLTNKTAEVGFVATLVAGTAGSNTVDVTLFNGSASGDLAANWNDEIDVIYEGVILDTFKVIEPIDIYLRASGVKVSGVLYTGDLRFVGSFQGFANPSPYNAPLVNGSTAPGGTKFVMAAADICQADVNVTFPYDDSWSKFDNVPGGMDNFVCDFTDLSPASNIIYWDGSTSAPVVLPSGTGEITLDAAVYKAKTPATVTVTVYDPSLKDDATSGDTLVVVISGGAADANVTLDENLDTGVFTKTFTVGDFGSGADVTASSAGTEFTMTATYSDLAPVASITTTAAVEYSTIGTCTLDASEYTAVSANDTVTVTVNDADLAGDGTVNVVITGGSTNVTLALTETGPTTGIFTGTFSVGTTVSGTADVDGAVNFTATVTYTDVLPADSIVATASILVAIPDFDASDGLSDPMWASAPSFDDASDGQSWAVCPATIKITNNATHLFVYIANEYADQQSKIIALLVDTDNNAGTGVTDFSANTDLYANPAGLTTTIGADYGWALEGDGNALNLQTVGNAVSKKTLGGTTVDVASSEALIGADTIELSVALADLGVASTDTITFAVVSLNTWSVGYQILDVAPGSEGTGANDTPATMTSEYTYVID